jgi:hypothetical protein
VNRALGHEYVKMLARPKRPNACERKPNLLLKWLAQALLNFFSFFVEGMTLGSSSFLLPSTNFKKIQMLIHAETLFWFLQCLARALLSSLLTFFQHFKNYRKVEQSKKWSRYGQIFMYVSTLFALEKPDWSTTKALSNEDASATFRWTA